MVTRVGSLVLLALVVLSSRADGQQAYKPPRTVDGRPDLQGIWQVVNAASWDLEDHAATLGVPAGLSVVEGGEIPYKPEALAQRNKNRQERLTADPATKCYLPGVPRVTYMPYPFQIFQTPGHIAITYEYVHAVRRIFMNTPHPDGELEWFMGDSRGRWEGDTLVVDVKDFTGMTWFDRSGNFHSESLHVVERYTPTGANNINYEVTIEDPKVFTRTWKMSMPLYRRVDKGMRILENECYAFGLEHTWLRPPQ